MTPAVRNRDGNVERLDMLLRLLDQDPKAAATKAFVWVEEAAEPVERGFSLISRGAANHAKGDLGGAENDYREARKLLNCKSVDGLNRVDIALADFLARSQGNFEEADRGLRRVARRRVTGVDRCRLEMTRGVLASQQGLYPKATRWLRRAARGFDELGQKVDAAKATAN